MFHKKGTMALLALCILAGAADEKPACGQAAADSAVKNAMQAPAAASQSKLPSYDVVTIRPNKQGPGSIRISTNLDVYAATNVSLVDLLNGAYSLKPGMLSGEPGWADSARFDIHAKILDVDAGELKQLKPEDRQRMMRELLASRFGLQAHYETKTLPVYELVRAKGGSKLQAISSQEKGSTFRGVSNGSTSIHGGAHGYELDAHSLSMDQFISTLSAQVNRSVVDKTGMAGLYDFHLEWTRDDAPASDEGGGPPLLIALEEQLGLKLLAAKAPVQTLVVDHAVPPSEDEN